MVEEQEDQIIMRCNLNEFRAFLQNSDGIFKNLAYNEPHRIMIPYDTDSQMVIVSRPSR